MQKDLALSLVRKRLEATARNGISHWGFSPGRDVNEPKKKSYFLNEWHRAKVLLKRFHLNGHTFGFLPQTQKLDRQTKLIVPCEKPLNSFRLMVTSQDFIHRLKN